MVSLNFQTTSQFQTTIQNSYNNPKDSDITFILAEDTTISAHQSIVYPQSEYFVSQRKLSESRTCRIDLTSHSPILASTLLKHLYNVPLPQSHLSDPYFLHDLLQTAQLYEIPTLKSTILVNFSTSLNTVWGKETFINLVVKLYEPSLTVDEEPLYDLRVRIADFVAKKMLEKDGAVDKALADLGDVLDCFGDFGEDVMGALQD